MCKHFPLENMILATFHVTSPRLQDLEPFPHPNNSPPPPFITYFGPPLLLFLPLLLILFIKTSANGSAVVSSYVLGAKVFQIKKEPRKLNLHLMKQTDLHVSTRPRRGGQLQAKSCPTSEKFNAHN